MWVFVFFYIYRNIFLFGNTNGRILYQGTSYSKYFSNICNRNALYPMYCSLAVIATFCKHYKEENLLKDEYLRLSKQHYETLLKNTQEI